MVYYQKYLKYKQKYLDLKQYIGGSIFELDLDNEKDINLQNLEEKLNKLSNIKVTNKLGNFFGIKIKTKNNVYNCIVRFIYDQIIIFVMAKDCAIFENQKYLDKYVIPDGKNVLLEINLSEKMASSLFLSDMKPLLKTGINYDARMALNLISECLVSKM